MPEFTIDDGATTWAVGQVPALVYLSATPDGRPVLHRVDDPDRWAMAETAELDARDRALLDGLLSAARRPSRSPSDPRNGGHQTGIGVNSGGQPWGLCTCGWHGPGRARTGYAAVDAHRHGTGQSLDDQIPPRCRHDVRLRDMDEQHATECAGSW